MPKVIDLIVILYIACLSFNATSGVAVNSEETYATTDSDGILLDSKNLDIDTAESTVAVQVTDPDENLRCFCNLPVCAATNYMCVTSNRTGGCFSEIHQSESEVGLPKHHGCVEFLKKSKSDLVCDNEPRKHSLAPPFGEILVLCCQSNLCNYLHYEANQKSAPNRDSSGSMSSRNNNNDLWFKVAIIIVPILGIIIVALLIILAIKMLKSDGLESPFKPSIDNLGPNYYKTGIYGVKAVNVEEGRGARNAPNGDDHEVNSSLLTPSTNAASSSDAVSNHCDKKNENLAKQNQLLSLEYRLLPCSYQDPTIKLLNTEDGVINNLYSKNFNAPSNTATVQQISNNVKSDKVYKKEFLNPVVVNWSSHYKD